MLAPALLVILLAALLVAAGFRRPLAFRWRTAAERRRRARLEDVLKHVYTRQQEGRDASLESVAGHLRIGQGRAVRLATELESRGLARSGNGTLRLTAGGEDWAREVIRAHRLWETYLANEARLPMAKVHAPAEREEHRLTADAAVDALDAALGHPRSDPHGDPIPRAAGDAISSPARSLADWPAGVPAEVAHVEDEPEEIFTQILARGLRPGAVLTVRETLPDRLRLRGEAGDFELSRIVAGNVQVRGVSAEPARRAGLVPLSEIATGEEAEVALLDTALRGFTRRRLLDLGLTAGARVTAALGNAFGDPRAYRVRGTTIALRRDQAAHIWVKREARA
jgi:DtxR family Mn-dependent transcriptional regulator